jgi:hypothetical protein
VGVEPRHPDLAQSLVHLGIAFAYAGDLDAARFLIERALSIREDVLGISG